MSLIRSIFILNNQRQINVLSSKLFQKNCNQINLLAKKSFGFTSFKLAGKQNDLDQKSDKQEDFDIKEHERIFKEIDQLEGFNSEHFRKKHKKFFDEESKYNGTLIYVGRLTSSLKRAKAISLSSSVLGLASMPYLMTTLNATGLFAQIFVYGTVTFFTFVTPLFSQFLGRRYVARIYYNYEEKKFKAILVSFLMYEYAIEFALDDIFVPDLPGIFSTARVKSLNRNLFIDFDTFNDIDLVKKIYGYDKPFDSSKYK